MRKTVLLSALLALVMLFVLTVTGCGSPEETSEQPAPEQGKPQSVAQNSGSAEADLPPPGNPVIGDKPPMPAPVNVRSPQGYRVETYVSGLQVPWDIAFVSRNRAYVTERPGRIRLIENGRLRQRPYHVITAVDRGEGGLLGITLHPDYPNPRWLYVMYTYRSGGDSYNRISRFTDTGSGLTDEKAVVTRIPAAFVHNGGIIRFGPDGMLYAGTGDSGEPELAQDRSSLAGKILRMTPEGKPASGNPFPNSLVYAYGFRNVQGLAWNPGNGDLWATTHGPTGEFGLRARDAVYIVQKGGNHGWPRVLGATDRRGVVDPVLFYPNTAVPPALATFYNGSLMPNLRGNFFFASLRGNHLERVVLSGPRKIERIERWWKTGDYSGVYGRLRAVVQGPDGALYVSTSNQDGRSNPRPGDDRILRITPVQR